MSKVVAIIINGPSKGKRVKIDAAASYLTTGINMYSKEIFTYLGEGYYHSYDGKVVKDDRLIHFWAHNDKVRLRDMTRKKKFRHLTCIQKVIG